MWLPGGVHWLQLQGAKSIPDILFVLVPIVIGGAAFLYRNDSYFLETDQMMKVWMKAELTLILLCLFLFIGRGIEADNRIFYLLLSASR